MVNGANEDIETLLRNSKEGELLRELVKTMTLYSAVIFRRRKLPGLEDVETAVNLIAEAYNFASEVRDEIDNLRHKDNEKIHRVAEKVFSALGGKRLCQLKKEFPDILTRSGCVQFKEHSTFLRLSIDACTYKEDITIAEERPEESSLFSISDEISFDERNLLYREVTVAGSEKRFRKYVDPFNYYLRPDLSQAYEDRKVPASLLERFGKALAQLQRYAGAVANWEADFARFREQQERRTEEFKDRMRKKQSAFIEKMGLTGKLLVGGSASFPKTKLIRMPERMGFKLPVAEEAELFARYYICVYLREQKIGPKEYQQMMDDAPNKVDLFIKECFERLKPGLREKCRLEINYLRNAGFKIEV
ncbi:hypothetical protein KY325_05105 [Candidatus Woesearchaeota archaeon]|nr:hypothetical protein [Candidatus Woesearchaeota archaeon]